MGTSFWRLELWSRFLVTQPIRFEAERVVRIRKQQFRVLVWLSRNHLTIMSEL